MMKVMQGSMMTSLCTIGIRFNQFCVFFLKFIHYIFTVCVCLFTCVYVLSIWEKVLEKEIEKGGMTLGQSVTDHRCGRIITLFKQCLILEKSLPSSASVSVSLRKGTDSVIWTS